MSGSTVGCPKAKTWQLVMSTYCVGGTVGSVTTFQKVNQVHFRMSISYFLILIDAVAMLNFIKRPQRSPNVLQMIFRPNLTKVIGCVLDFQNSYSQSKSNQPPNRK